MSGVSFPLLGFRVDVHPGFGVLAGILTLFQLQGGTGPVAVAGMIAILFTSVLVHELGHALTATRLGLRVREVAIHGFGGHVLHEPGPAGKQLLISLAGPGAGLLLGLPLVVVLLTRELPPTAIDLLGYAAFVNVGWGLFNLLPMLPLDGGNALTSVLQLALGGRRGRQLAARVGVGTGVVVAALALWFDETWILVIGGFCAYTSYQTLQRSA